MSSSGSNAGMAMFALLVVQWHHFFHSIPHVSQTLAEVIHILHFCLIYSLLNNEPDVVNWIEVMAVRRPQTSHDECMVITCTCTWHLIRHFRPRPWHMITTKEDWERPIFLDIRCVAGLGWVSAPQLQPHLLQYVCISACNWNDFCRYFMLLAAYSVTYPGLPSFRQCQAGDFRILPLLPFPFLPLPLPLPPHSLCPNHSPSLSLPIHIPSPVRLFTLNFTRIYYYCSSLTLLNR